MSERNPALIIKDMVYCIDHIMQYTEGLNFDDFTDNFMLREAYLYNLQVIGEAVVQLPDLVKDSEPTIPWKLIKGMRNRLIHSYIGTDMPTVWNVITNELPSFKNELQRIYNSLNEQDW